jgi:hypothetical protein
MKKLLLNGKGTVMKSLLTTLMVLMILVVSSSVMASVVADYRFDTSEGTEATDSSGNDNHGTLIGFTDLDFGYADNPANPGYTSNGMIRLVSGDTIEYIESAVTARGFITNSFTIEAITSLHSNPSYWQPLVGYVSDEAFIYWGSGGSSAAPHWHIDNGGPWTSYPAYENILTDGEMHHYAITYDAENHEMNMYLDSVVPIATAYGVDLSNAVAEDDTGVLLIGSHMGSSSYEVWNGLIDRIRFSDEVVSPEDFIPIPEPATVCILSLGALSLIRRKK